MKKNLLISALIIFAILISSCLKNDLDDIKPDPNDISTMDVPEEFDYSTTKNVSLEIIPNGTRGDGSTRYDFYIYEERPDTIIRLGDNDEEIVIDTLSMITTFNNHLATKIVKTGASESFTLTVPEWAEQIYVVKDNYGLYSSERINIAGIKSVRLKRKILAEDPADILYGVGDKKVFTINPVSGERTTLAALPADMGSSYTCAMDIENRIMYTIGSISPYKLYAFDIDTKNFEFRGNTEKKGIRLAYDSEESILLYSNKGTISKIDTSNGTTILNSSITGLHNTSNGDLVYDESHTLYLVSRSGLYRLDSSGDNYDAIRVSADDFPYILTSLAYDSNNELWIADTGYRLLVMDKSIGAYEIRYTYPGNFIADLTTLPLDESLIPDTDSDGDGVVDYYDKYPDDPDAAFDTYTPSAYGWGTYVFEDLWPHKGDYDFNDLVLNYRYLTVLNSANKAVRMSMEYKVNHIGASFTNGFGLDMPGLDPAKLSGVTGQQLNDGIITNNANGSEAGHDGTVIILFDNAFDILGQELALTIEFTEALDEEFTGLSEVNPFIIVDQERGREVHLPNYPPTALADESLFGTGEDDSDSGSGKYYKTANNLPWGLNIPHNFVHPKEKADITKGYLRFRNWAESGGQDYADWYKDQDGNRNSTYLDN